mgnify:CR=1 FL=1
MGLVYSILIGTTCSKCTVKACKWFLFDEENFIGQFCNECAERVKREINPGD